MRRSIMAPFLLAALASVVATAHAGSISGTLSGDATLTTTGTPGVYVQNFSGDGDDTLLGFFTSQSTSTVDFSNPPHILFTNGMISETFAQGTLSGTSSGSGTANGMGMAKVTIDFVITGGTGLFAGDTGDVTINATITKTSATTEAISGTYAGSLSSVPEPSSVALLATALAVGALVELRRRRHKAIGRPSDLAQLIQAEVDGGWISGVTSFTSVKARHSSCS